MSEQNLVYSSKINKIRSFALFLIFAGMIVMYIGVFARKIPWLMFTLFVIGVLLVLLSTVVYFCIGMLSTKAIPIICPSCAKPIKMVGREYALMHYKQTITLDQSVESLDFDEKYNSKCHKLKLKKEQK